MRKRNALPGDKQGVILRGVTTEISESSIADISHHFHRRCKGISNGRITVFHGSPEIISALVDITKLEHNGVASFKISLFIPALIPVKPRLHLHFISCSI